MTTEYEGVVTEVKKRNQGYVIGVRCYQCVEYFWTSTKWELGQTVLVKFPETKEGKVTIEDAIMTNQS